MKDWRLHIFYKTTIIRHNICTYTLELHYNHKFKIAPLHFCFPYTLPSHMSYASKSARLESRVSWVRIPPKAALLFSLEERAVLGVVDLFALPCLSTSLPSFCHTISVMYVPVAVIAGGSPEDCHSRWHWHSTGRTDTHLQDSGRWSSRTIWSVTKLL